MRYTGAEAYDLAYHNEEFAPQVAPRTPFEVHEGSGLDARARQGVSPEFLRRAQKLVLVAIALAVIFAARICIFTATAAQLNANAELRDQVDTATQLERDLKVTTSTLSSASRIDSIATQNYGMVRASDTEIMSLEEGTSYTMNSVVAQSERDLPSVTAEKKASGTSVRTTSAPADLAEVPASGTQADASVVK